MKKIKNIGERFDCHGIVPYNCGVDVVMEEYKK